MFVIRLTNGEEAQACEGDELTIHQETGVLTVSPEDGLEQTTTRHSPSAWQSVTQRNPGQGVRPLLISTARRCGVDRTVDLQQTPIKSTIIGPQFTYQGACDQGFCGLRPFLWTWVGAGRGGSFRALPDWRFGSGRAKFFHGRRDVRGCPTHGRCFPSSPHQS
jgi:hypothetical protein